VARSGLAAPLTTPHSVRHSAIAAWIAAGATNPYHLARWAGHRDVGTVFRLYGHLLPVDASAGRAALAAFRRQALARRADGAVPAARREPER
jgi:integrase